MKEGCPRIALVRFKEGSVAQLFEPLFPLLVELVVRCLADLAVGQAGQPLPAAGIRT